METQDDWIKQIRRLGIEPTTTLLETWSRCRLRRQLSLFLRSSPALGFCRADRRSSFNHGLWKHKNDWIKPNKDSKKKQTRFSCLFFNSPVGLEQRPCGYALPNVHINYGFCTVGQKNFHIYIYALFAIAYRHSYHEKIVHNSY